MSIITGSMWFGAALLWVAVLVVALSGGDDRWMLVALAISALGVLLLTGAIP